MSSVSSIINSDATYTAQLKAKTDTLTGAAGSNLNQSDFLALLTQQLQFQDPMEPQDNSQFISQMAQFSQLESTTETHDLLSSSTAESKANSLVGEGVVLTDPNDTSKTITGTVEGARLNGTKSGVVVNGTTYPLEYLLYSYDPASVTSQTGSGGSK